MEFKYILVNLILVLIFGLCLYFLNKKTKVKFNNLEKKKLENVNELNVKIENLISIHKNEIQKEKIFQLESVNKITNEYDTKIQKLNDYIKETEKYSRNFGEINTHNILTEYKKDLINREIITKDDMIILGNLFVPYEHNGQIKSHQIDHLILMKNAAFIIETKYWRGQIIHGMSKQRAKDFKVLYETLFPNTKPESEHTIVVYDESSKNESKALKITSYGNPSVQVMKTALKLNDFLKEKGFNIFINPIVYFGYSEENVKNFSQQNDNVFFKKEELFEFMEETLAKSKKVYDIKELMEIQRIIETANYLPEVNNQKK